MTLAKRIQSCKSLTPVEMIIADYILKNEKQILQMTILEMADSIHVSKSALHRFSKKIGLKGFNDIKVEISKNQVNMEDQW
jgi:DNA-binding MurR/RpiR family transcriptional regulator